MNFKEKIIVISIVLTVGITIVSSPVFGQEYLDLSNFTKINNGYWLLNSDNTRVTQLDKTTTDFYYLSEKEIENRIIKGTFKVDTFTYDSDTFGLVFGYQNINDSYIFAWDNGGLFGAGQIFYHKKQAFVQPAIPGEILFDGRAANAGWEKGKEYNFKAVYLKNNFKLSIDGKEVININGEFPKGKFGFFCFSQAYVNFYNIEVTSADHLIEPPRPPLEEMEEPIKINKNTTDKTLANFDLSYQTYQIVNSSEYEIKKAYVKIEIDPHLKLIEDSLKISEDQVNSTFFRGDNILKISNFTLQPSEVLDIGFYVKPDSDFTEAEKYENEIGIYSKNNNSLVSDKIMSVIKYNRNSINYSALLIGRVNIFNKEISEHLPFKIITSDGKVIKVDRLGRYHILFNNFSSLLDTEKVVLEIKLPKRYNKYTIAGAKTKLIEVRPGQLIKQDFNLKLGGQNDG